MDLAQLAVIPDLGLVVFLIFFDADAAAPSPVLALALSFLGSLGAMRSEDLENSKKRNEKNRAQEQPEEEQVKI